MVCIAFWNVRGGTAFPYLGSLCDEHSVDILVLAEDSRNPVEKLAALNLNRTTRNFYEISPLSNYVKMLTWLPSGSIHPVSDSGRISVRMLKPPIGMELLIVGVHLISKLHADEADQRLAAQDLKAVIDEAEHRTGCCNTIVIGDFNFNPYEEAMVGASGLHAISDRKIASGVSRLYKEREHKFFYNPAWAHVGDNSGTPPGTHFYNSSKAVNAYWHTFDQAIIRPSLLPYMEDNSFSVLHSLKGKNLIKNGRIDQTISDHLPILLNIQTERKL